MTDQEIVYEIIKDINDLRKRYLGVWLDDFLWERLIDEQKQLSVKYKAYGDNAHNLYCRMAAALVGYKEQQQKEIRSQHGAMKGGMIISRKIGEDKDDQGK
ncbi:MAG: hypothetical protein IJ794_09720 [Lachnospiraceae bacterium]|nr:hypothetical protein [Lachnospiraceae bacterium]